MEPTESAPMDPVERPVAPNHASAPLTIPPELPRRRRWLVPLAMVVTLAIGVGGTVLALRPWQDDAGANAAAESTDADAAASDQAAPLAYPTARLILDPVPEGFEVGWINDPEQNDGADFGPPVEGTFVLLAGDAATLAEGPWLTVNVRRLQPGEEQGFDPRNNLPVEQARSVTIGEYSGAVGESFDGSKALGFGPIAGDYIVGLAAEGLTEQQLVALATSLRFKGSRPQLSPNDLPVAMDVLTTGNASWDASPASALTNFAASINVSYQATGTSQFGPNPDNISLISQLAERPGDDVIKLARFMLSDSSDTTVHGLPAVVGSFDAFGGGFGTRTAVWVEDGDLIVLSATEGAGDVAALAENVRPADPDEWDDLFSEMQRRQQEMERLFSSPPDTWLIAAGDLPSSTTWAAEGAVLDGENGGGFIVSVNEFSANGSSSMGFDPAAAITEFPAIAVQTGQEAQTIVGLGPLDPTGVILRVTLDDGTVIEVPLRTVREEWPASAAATAVAGNRTGVAEIIDADGAVLVTKTFEANAWFNAEGDPAVATTAVAIGD